MKQPEFQSIFSEF